MFITLHIHIAGTVQGVFFRSTTKGKADELNIKGWVRNCDDGSVEIIAQGKKGALRKFTEWCLHGPSSASVTRAC